VSADGKTYEAPTVAPLGRPQELRTSKLMHLAADLIAPFAWGKPIADELRFRGDLLALETEATPFDDGLPTVVKAEKDLLERVRELVR
jgi:hypothetical protein